MAGEHGAKKCIWKPRKFMTGDSKGLSWLAANSSSVDTTHWEAAVTPERPAAHRLPQPPAPLPRSLRHNHLSPLPLLGTHRTSLLLLGSTGERGWVPGSSVLHGFHAHPPSLIPGPKTANDSQSLLLHPLLYRILSSAAEWDKTSDYKEQLFCILPAAISGNCLFP